MLNPMLTVAAVTLLAVPSTAAASSLLSGYGGPGQGNQAILGSTFLNGPSNRGGGGSSGGGGSGTASLARLAAPATAVQEAGSASSPGRHSRPSAVARHKPPKHGGRLAPSSAPNYQPVPSLARSAAGGSGALGVSGADLLYMILALGGLILTALLTRQLVRGEGASRDPAAKGIARQTRGTE
jgi:hypothetical protein